MKKDAMLFGKTIGYDPRIIENTSFPQKLTIKNQKEGFLFFFSKSGRLITLAQGAQGRGPDRILTEKLPTIGQNLDLHGWALERTGINFQGSKVLLLKGGLPCPSGILSAVVDFPGHLRTILGRYIRSLDPELKIRLKELGQALKAPLTEAVEVPLIRVIGYGGGEIPIGDDSLCGMLLTAKALLKGKRMRVDWQSRLSMDVRRLLHRTSKFSSAFLNFALEGRTTLLQERFFEAMARDQESLGDTVTNDICKSGDFSGDYFLLGSFTALEIIRSDIQHAETLAYSKGSGKLILSKLS